MPFSPGSVLPWLSACMEISDSNHSPRSWGQPLESSLFSSGFTFVPGAWRRRRAQCGLSSSSGLSLPPTFWFSAFTCMPPFSRLSLLQSPFSGLNFPGSMSGWWSAAASERTFGSPSPSFISSYHPHAALPPVHLLSCCRSSAVILYGGLGGVSPAALSCSIPPRLTVSVPLPCTTSWEMPGSELLSWNLQRAGSRGWVLGGVSEFTCGQSICKEYL